MIFAKKQIKNKPQKITKGIIKLGLLLSIIIQANVDNEMDIYLVVFDEKAFENLL